jgi:hypothetical protein
MYTIVFTTEQDSYHIERDPKDYDETYQWNFMSSEETPHAMPYQEILEILKRPSKYVGFPEVTGVFHVYKLDAEEIPISGVTDDMQKIKRDVALSKLTEEEIQLLGIKI